MSNGQSPDSDAVPCPDCGYDLRAQTETRCPECGVTFESFEEMKLRSGEALRPYLHILRWRKRVAYLFAGGFLSVFAMLFFALVVQGVRGRRMDDTPPLFLFAPFIGLFLAAGALALYLLITIAVCLYRSRVPRAHKRELLASIPLLLFYQLPALLALLVAAFI